MQLSRRLPQNEFSMLYKTAYSEGASRTSSLAFSPARRNSSPGALETSTEQRLINSEPMPPEFEPLMASLGCRHGGLTQLSAYFAAKNTESPSPQPATTISAEALPLPEAILAATRAEDLQPVVEQLSNLCQALGLPEREPYPETLHYLRYPDHAGYADFMGRRARSLPAYVSLIEDIVLGREIFLPADMRLLAQVISILSEMNGFSAHSLNENSPDVDLTPGRNVDHLHADAPQRLDQDAAVDVGEKLAGVAATHYGDTGSAATAMQLYQATYRGFGDNARALIGTVPTDVLHRLMQSIRIYGSGDEKLQLRQVFERDLSNIAANRRYREQNQAILGCPESYHCSADARQSGVLRPGQATIFEMRAALGSPSGQVAYPRVINVAAPALDSLRQPEVRHYLDSADRLMPAAYERQIATIFSRLLQATQAERPGRVVLSAIGTKAFLNLLNDEDKATAQGIVARHLADLAATLRARGIDVAYTDVAAGGPVWALVDRHLQEAGEASLDWLGPVPGEWVKSSDLLVNGADNAAVAGNGGKHDRSIDGAFGANSTLHAQHTLMCRLYNDGALRLPADAFE
ncbi:hypothetical protein [Xylophilus sp. GOD-11R]|uniref:hypothetical protein n=1 Tax=Xylophilus sp. GOD-11R TaxID=3089814 RepID=UPI00298CB645|nr:hypothetical protein [Xylophilus sp. GOD-11R]WPB56378.1 hypothetical protein R9X41_19900 [Xylophilus sp. GOD-11R]